MAHGKRSSILRGAATVTLALVVAGALAGVSTGAGKALTKKKALKLFFTKGGADARFLNVGEVATSYKQETTLINDFDVTNFADVLEHQVTVPQGGSLLIWANVTFEHDATGGASPTPVETRVLLDGTQVGTSQQAYIEATAGYSDSTANAIRTTVQAGQHTIKLQAYNAESGWIAIEDRSITTAFLPE